MQLESLNREDKVSYERSREDGRKETVDMADYAESA
jgi:hypothetical protein